MNIITTAINDGLLMENNMVVNGAKSNMRLVECGVPQRSTLGALPFLIYVKVVLAT